VSAPRAFRLGYSSLTWGETPDLEEMLAAIAGAGWEGVEFIGMSSDWLGTPRRLRALLDRHGLLAVCMFGTISLGPDSEIVLERQRRLIEYAADLGCSVYCFLGGQRVVRRLPTEDEVKRLAEQSEILIDYATPRGLTVAYHAHPRCTIESEEEQDRLLAFSDRLKVCVDVSVAALMGEDAIAQLRKYRDRLAYVHMKDWKGGKFCVMGKGTVGLDFGRIRETLEEVGYSGWVIGELSSYADTAATESCYANRAYLRSVGYR
jgi:inosose dehydratase